MKLVCVMLSTLAQAESKKRTDPRATIECNAHAMPRREVASLLHVVHATSPGFSRDPIRLEFSGQLAIAIFVARALATRVRSRLYAPHRAE